MRIYNVNCPDIKNWYTCNGVVKGFKVAGFGTSHWSAFKMAMGQYYTRVGQNVDWREIIK